MVGRHSYRFYHINYLAVTQSPDSVITQFALLLILITIKFNLFTIRWQYTVLKYVSLNLKNAKFFTAPSKFLMLQGS